MSISEKFANYIGYSDVTPYEIVRVVSDRTLEVREMKTAQVDWKPDFIPGGFCGHVANQSEQKWSIEPDEAAPVVRIRLGKKGWRSAGGGRFVLADKPRKFYDYNF